MSWTSYTQSRELAAGRGVQSEPTFAALIMAAARRADSTSFAKLDMMFPDIVGELQLRYDAPGGLLEGER